MPLLRKLSLAMIVVLTACSEPPPSRPQVEVIVDSVESQLYHPFVVLVGRLQALDDVHIQAKVSGYLKERPFKEGRRVEQGDLLYVIDPSSYRTELAAARAELARMQAAHVVANANYDRGVELSNTGYISKSEMDHLTSAKLQADANLEGARANLERAEVNLSYTRITAPISGRIGSSKVSVGDLIGPDSGALTTLVAADPIKAVFQISESGYLRAIGALHQSFEEVIKNRVLTVSLELADGEKYPYEGYIDYVANRIDEKTGTIEGRALIPNPKGFLRPGQYVKVEIRTVAEIPELMVPQAAIQADQQGEFALVVDANGVVGRRNVVLSNRVGDKVIVRQGLIADDTVIVRGLQKVRPGQVVTAKHMDSAQPGAATR